MLVHLMTTLLQAIMDKTAVGQSMCAERRACKHMQSIAHASTWCNHTFQHMSYVHMGPFPMCVHDIVNYILCDTMWYSAYYNTRVQHNPHTVCLFAYEN